MPFPPEYLAPPAERVKKERKIKTPKHKKNTPGKVREEGYRRCLDNYRCNTHTHTHTHTSVTMQSMLTIHILSNMINSENMKMIRGGGRAVTYFLHFREAVCAYLHTHSLAWLGCASFFFFSFF